MSLDAALTSARAEVQATLDAALAPFQGPVAEAMRYATDGGKRLRAVLAFEAAALFEVPLARAARAAAAIEAMHAYSLIHDDLPCMDDDDLRRGRPTVHRRWDEATAVLAGDALQTLAFEIVAGPETDPDPGVRADLILTLAQAIRGCGNGAGPGARHRRRERGGAAGPGRDHGIAAAQDRASVGMAVPGGRHPGPGRSGAVDRDYAMPRWGWRSRSRTTCWTWRAMPRRWARRWARMPRRARRPSCRCWARRARGRRRGGWSRRTRGVNLGLR